MQILSAGTGKLVRNHTGHGVAVAGSDAAKEIFVSINMKKKIINDK